MDIQTHPSLNLDDLAQSGAYLIHFSVPIGTQQSVEARRRNGLAPQKRAYTRPHAQHYLGSANDVLVRYSEHVTGYGAKICEAAVNEGADLIVVKVWPGGDIRKREKELKRQKNHKRFCPICQEG